MNYKKSKRDLDTDVMRILAAFGVVMIHASTMESNIGVFLNAISRFSVPLFILISGYYMLDSPISYSKIFKKCLNLFLKMITWSLIYYIFGIVCGTQSTGNIKTLIWYLLTSPEVLWYIWAAITLYIFTPMLFVFCENAEHKDYIYGLLITFFFGSIVNILMRSGYFELIVTIVEKMKVAHLLGFVFLYLLGGYFRRYKITSEKIKYMIYLGGILGIIVTYAGTMTFLKIGENELLLLSFFSPNTIFMSVAVFVFVKNLFEKVQIKKQWICNAIHEIAECTLGVYLIHTLVLQFSKVIVGFVLNDETSGIFVISKMVIGCIISVLIVMVVKRIPVLKKLVI